MTLWLTQAKNGGVNGDGMVTFTTADGETFEYPCLQKITADIAKGDDARQDLAMFFGGTFGPNETLGQYTTVADIQYDPSQSFAKAITAPQATAVITILKNGSPWGTITFNAGSTVGVISIPAPVQTRGEELRFVAPATYDQAFTGVSATLAGAI